MVWPAEFKRLKNSAFVVSTLFVSFVSVLLSACGPSTTSTGLSQSPVVIDITSSESQAVIAIMNSQCVSCHGSNGAGGVSNINDLNAVYAQGLIVPGSPTSSDLYLEVAAGTMPPSGGPMSNADVAAIRTWIENL